MKKAKKPTKKNDIQIWNLISECIKNANYVFVPHAKQRLKERSINDLEVLNILENKENRKRKRNKKKDTYLEDKPDWNYCIEGLDIDEKNIRIIISFNENNMLIITVMYIHNLE